MESFTAVNINTSMNTFVDSCEDANGIAEVYPIRSFYDHVETVAGTHISTNNLDQVAYEGILHALCGGPHKHSSFSMMDTQSVQGNKSAVTVNSGDANQVAQSRLHTHFHLSHIPNTEQPSFKSRVADPFELSPYNVPSGASVVSTQPYHKRRRTEHRNSSNTAPTGFFPTFTVSEDRTSLASTSTVDKEFACPKCNMGDGHTIRPYTRKGGTPADKNVSAETANSNQEIKPPKIFKNTACFDRHVIAAHRRDFKSSDSSEYICRYCPCGIVDGHLACAARFEENDFDGLLQHLRESHARPSLQYKNNPHDHWCASSAKSFQLQSLHDLAHDPSEPFFGL